MIGWLRWLALPIAVAVFVGASSPRIAQRTPRFLFPAFASLGAALLVLSLIQAARDLRSGARRPAVGLAVLAVATLLFAVLPFARFAYMMAPSAGGAPRILTGFGDRRGAEGYPLLDPHRGSDVKGRVGTDVLAAAEGRVTVRDNQDLCGLMVVVPADSARGPATSTCTWSCSAGPIPGICTTRSRELSAASTRARGTLRIVWRSPTPCPPDLERNEARAYRRRRSRTARHAGRP